MNRTIASSTHPRRLTADAARLSLAVAAGCFVAALFGCIGNQFVPDVLCAEGLAIVGCFYLIIGAIDFIRVRPWKSCGQHEIEAKVVRSKKVLGHLVGVASEGEPL